MEDKVTDFGANEAIEVSSLPKCDLCIHIEGKSIAEASTAHYDAKTVNGPWANMCTTHYARYGYGLGLGLGQRLILKESN